MVARHATFARSNEGTHLSTMTLVRHGQASFFASDYDRLSSMGEEQSQLLGQYWSVHGFRFDQVYSGPRLRQQQTAEWIGEAYRQNGGDWPAPIHHAGLDEYDLKGLVEHLAPALAIEDPHFASLVDASQQSTTQPEHLRNFQAMFERLMLKWQSEIRPIANVERWPDFRKRVENTIRQIQNEAPKGCRVAVVTSGGFIGTAVQSTLAAPDRTALELNWRVRNCSLTELVFTRDRLTLDSFNAVPHLPNPSHWTYR